MHDVDLGPIWDGVRRHAGVVSGVVGGHATNLKPTSDPFLRHFHPRRQLWRGPPAIEATRLGPLLMAEPVFQVGIEKAGVLEPVDHRRLLVVFVRTRPTEEDPTGQPQRRTDLDHTVQLARDPRLGFCNQRDSSSLYFLCSEISTSAQ